MHSIDSIYTQHVYCNNQFITEVKKRENERIILLFKLDEINILLLLNNP
jgi:hypothetical protein